MDVGMMQAWLRSSRNYEHGLQLLVDSGAADDDDLFLLELGETSVSRAHLVRALERVVVAEIKSTKARRTVQREVITRADIVQEMKVGARDPRNDGYEQDALPPRLQAVHDQIKKDFKEMAYHRSRLEVLPAKSDRYDAAERVATLDEAIASGYTRLDTWKATGRDPGEHHVPERPAAANPVQLVKELRNLVSYLARHNTGARKSPAEKVQQWERRRKELEEMLADVT